MIFNRSCLFFPRRNPDRRQCLVSGPRTGAEVLCLFVSPSILRQVIPFPMSSPLLHPHPHHYLSLLSLSVAIQLRKCCETSDSTSCCNQYISGPADAQLRMHWHTHSFSLLLSIFRTHTHTLGCDFYTVCNRRTAFIHPKFEQNVLTLPLRLSLKRKGFRSLDALQIIHLGAVCPNKSMECCQVSQIAPQNINVINKGT